MWLEEWRGGYVNAYGAVEGGWYAGRSGGGHLVGGGAGAGGGGCRPRRQVAPGQTVLAHALDTPVHFWLSGTLCPDQMLATDAVCFREQPPAPLLWPAESQCSKFGQSVGISCSHSAMIAAPTLA